MKRSTRLMGKRLIRLFNAGLIQYCGKNSDGKSGKRDHGPIDLVNMIL